MKHLFLTSLLIFLSTAAKAQKEDYIWLFGYDYNTITSAAEEIKFSFVDSLDISFRQRPMSLDQTNASLCDSLGRLMLYTNGCYIANGNDSYIENSDGLNPGYFYDDNCKVDSNGYPSSQSAMFLPHPTHENLKYLFHVGTYFSINPLIGFDDKLYYTVVDIAENAGMGKVISKNNLLVQDTFHDNGFHAVRHANGRDWWVVIPKAKSNQYFIICFSGQDLSVKTQSIGAPVLLERAGELVFSPDGTKMARFNPGDDLTLLDFDRCYGTFSNPIQIPIVDDADIEIFGGLAFSADGHYLYVSEVKRLLQFDMWETDIASSKTLVAEVDPITNCALGKSISFMELAPDGRIYCRPLNGQRCMHRIAKPEKAAVDCDFQQYYYRFSNTSYRNMPHFPNFRLGPVDGSICDTLGLNNYPLAGWRYDASDAPLAIDFTSVSSYEPTAWSWEFGNPVLGISSERNPSFVFPSSGNYEVCLTVSNQFGNNTRCKVITIGANTVDNPQTQPNIQISPVPFMEYISIKMHANFQSATFALHNHLGRTVLTKPIDLPINIVDTHELPSGIYFWDVSLAGKIIQSGKTIKL